MNAKNVRHGIQAMFILVARSRSFILFCGMNKFGTASQAKCLNIGFGLKTSTDPVCWLANRAYPYFPGFPWEVLRIY